MRPRLAGTLVTVLALGLSACERADEQASDTGSTTLTVYASLPFQGPSGPESEAVANGARLALREAGGTVGGLVVKLAVLDDSTPRADRWTAEQAAENARTVVRDRTAIAYLGDGPSGATAISLPILNAAGVLQVSPTSGYQGLTGSRDAEKGEPEKYYPSGVRTFARPVPGDDVQARALLASLDDERCRRLQVLDDRDVAGRGLATAVKRLAVASGIEVLARPELNKDAGAPEEAATLVERGADCVLFAGALSDSVPALFDALHAADPQLELFGGDGLASDAFAEALGPGTQARTHLTAPAGVLEPLPGVRAFAREYRAAFGVPARTGANYGYEAMRLVLAAIARAGPRGNDRTAVIDALFALGERQSPLGPYRIDANGNSTSTAYSRLGIRGGELVRRRTASFGSD
ncbi:MAG: branched-chain amino acid ABC transporter substrate-binding protein [Actinomycetota bacterium]|nr:branched-chain amino acid ABC transporter substrate-binding protein [Actinomycetota bacterium]